MGLRDLIKENQGTKKQTIIDPKEIFKKELVHLPGYEYLRDNQATFLAEWYKNKQQRDVVGILNTGAGKTLIGQLMLLSKMNELHEPVVYLCPDNQLVSQALQQASYHNIPVVTIQGKDLPSEFLNAEAILVTTFEKMYNGKSIFGVSGNEEREKQQIGALVIDDAHSCIRKARKQSSITFPRDSEPYQKLVKLFINDIGNQAYSAEVAIEKGTASLSRMVPYWSWKEKLAEVKNILMVEYDKKAREVLFPFNLLFDYLDSAQCFISGKELEISPIQNPLEKIPAYYNAKFRYVLSATFNNNYELISELGLDKDAVLNPIQINYGNDAGERLIISPRRLHSDISEEEIISILRKESQNNNIVILAPGDKVAEKWVKFGAQFVNKDNILDSLERLRTSQGNFMVFSNRYDGIDLMGDMCRILIMDGIPKGETARDRAIAFMRENSQKLKLQKAQTIEQGMGRSVRSSSDYSIVVLMGEQLLSFLAKKSNHQYFSSITKAQIDLMFEINGSDTYASKEEALKEIVADIQMCLSRDNEWIQFYKNYVEKADDMETIKNKHLVELSQIEKDSFFKYRNKNFAEAASIINDKILGKVEELNLTEEEEGWYYQVYAEIVDKFDKTRSNDLQIRAKEKNNQLFIPRAGSRAKRNKVASSQAQKCLEYITDFSYGNDLVLKMESLTSHLVFSNDSDSTDFETSLKEVGEFLGYRSTTPDSSERKGPDNFWETTNYDLVIECKNRSENERISREHIEQLLHSDLWYKNNYETRGNRHFSILAQKTNRLNIDAEKQSEFVVINEEKLKLFKSQLNEFSKALGSKRINEWDSSSIEHLLNTYSLTPARIIEKFTVTLAL